MTHKARDHGVHMHHCNQGEYVGSCKYGQNDTCPALKTPTENCPALKKFPKGQDPMVAGFREVDRLLNPEIEKALAECHLQCEQSEHGKAALAWMRGQAKAIDPRISDDLGPFYLARIIAPHIVLPKKKKVPEKPSIKNLPRYGLMCDRNYACNCHMVKCRGGSYIKVDDIKKAGKANENLF